MGDHHEVTGVSRGLVYVKDGAVYLEVPGFATIEFSPVVAEKTGHALIAGAEAARKGASPIKLLEG